MTLSELLRSATAHIFDFTHAPLILVNYEGKILDINPEAASFFEQKKENLIDSSFFHLFQDPNSISRELSETLTKKKRNFTCEIRDKTKTIQWYAETLSSEITNGREVIFLSGKDISSESASKEELEKFKKALDQAAIVAITDTAGKITYVNQKFCEISKYSKSELLGQNHRIINSGHHSKDFFKELWQTISNGKVWRGEVKNRAKDGSYYWVFTTIIPLPLKNGSYEYLAIRTDITREKQLFEEVLQQDRLASVGLISSGIAHEIGTPLGVIRGRAELLQINHEENKELFKGLEIINTQIDRISKLISSLLNFSRKSDDERLEEISPRTVIDEVTGLLDEKFRKNGIDVKVDVPADLRVMGNARKLEQIFLNLMINSIHAIEENTNEKPMISVSSIDGGKYVELRVRDSGCGIPKQNIHKLFQPFFTTKDIGKGTGLGLPNVAKLTQELGGKIQVESQEGSGSSFIISLPKI